MDKKSSKKRQSEKISKIKKKNFELKNPNAGKLTMELSKKHLTILLVMALSGTLFILLG